MTSRLHSFARDEVLPSYWVNRIQDRLGPLSNVRLVQASATTVQVPAGAGDDAAAISIEGRWRFNEAAVSVAHPGGAAGAYDVYVTASDQNVVSSPVPNTDN